MERYRLLELLGKGGMAEVYLADDLVLERRVALKFLAAELADDPSALERLQREARAAAALDHPFICTVHDTGRLDGRPFIAMEYVRGRTLRARLDEGPLAPEDAREKALAMVNALAAAHRQGIVHRDLKPANIMLTEQGHVKVMDFGLARRVDAQVVDGTETTLGAITQPGVRLGTPAYMSPEQVLGDEVGEPSDVFSFGIVLAEMLSAKHPFLKETAPATMAAIVRDRPGLPGGWPRPVRDLVESAMAKAPRDRPSFDEVARRLEEHAEWAWVPERPRERVRGERRTATLLVARAILADRASTLVEDEESIEAMRHAVDVMDEIVQRHGGALLERRHDAIVAVFGAPVAQEDAARGAVDASFEIRREMRTLGADVRAGLHTGPVVVEGEGSRARVTPVGDTARVTSQVESGAAPGEIRVSAHTAEAVAPYFECVAPDGDDGAVRVVARATGAHARFDAAVQRGLSPFVGRADELALLRGYAERAQTSEGQIVLLSGEAGMGKTRLMLELQRVLDPHRSAWIEAAASARGTGTPYFTLARLLRHVFGVDDADDLPLTVRRIDEATASWSREAQGTVPFLKTVLDVDSGDGRLALMDPVELRVGIHAGLAALLSERTRVTSMVLVVEDVHWIDAPSEEALMSAADLVAALPLLLVLTHRPGYLARIGTRAFAHRVSLGSLGRDEQHALIRSVLNDDSLPSEIADLVSTRTGGNPLYAEEVARSLVETGAIRPSGGSYSLDRAADQVRVPHTIEQVILARLDRVPASARETLQAAAVVGREFPVRLVAAMLAHSTTVPQDLEALKAADLVREVSRFPEATCTFRHALIHDVTSSTLLAGRRKELHRAAVEVIETIYADRLAAYFERLAHHAVEGHAWNRALDYLEHAAKRAASLFGVDEACAFYRRAIAVCGDVGVSATPRAIRLSRDLAELLTNVGRLPDALTALGEMRQLAVAAGDRRGEAITMALEGWSHGLAHNLAAAVAASKAAMEMVGPDDDEVRFLASGSLAFFLYNHHRVDEARPYLALAEELAPRVDDAYRQGWWSIIGWHQLQWEGRFDDTLTHLARWRSAAERSGSAFVAAGVGLEAWARAGKGEYSRALAMLADAMTTCDRQGNVFFRIRHLNTVGWIYAELQDHARALEWNRRGVAEALEARQPYPEVESNARLNVGDSLMALGDLDGAEAEFRHVEGVVRHPLPHQTMDLWRYAQHLFHSYGELWLIRGDPDRALAFADECLALAEPANHWKNVAKGRRLRGEALAAQGQHAHADQELSLALAAAERVGNPPQLWRTLAAIGELRLAEGRAEDARGYFIRASDVIDAVAGGLDDTTLRDTFLGSPHVQSIRRRATA